MSGGVGCCLAHCRSCLPPPPSLLLSFFPPPAAAAESVAPPRQQSATPSPPACLPGSSRRASLPPLSSAAAAAPHLARRGNGLTSPYSTPPLFLWVAARGQGELAPGCLRPDMLERGGSAAAAPAPSSLDKGTRGCFPPLPSPAPTGFPLPRQRDRPSSLPKWKGNCCALSPAPACVDADGS